MTGTSSFSRFFQPKRNDGDDRALEDPNDGDNDKASDQGIETSKDPSSSSHAVLTTVGSSAEDPLEIPDDDDDDDDDSLPGNALSSELPKQDKYIPDQDNDFGKPKGIDLTNSKSLTETQPKESKEEESCTIPENPPPVNPFAQFAYQASAATSSRPRPTLSWRQSNAAGSNVQTDLKDAKKKRKQETNDPVRQRVKKVKETANQFIPMASIPPDEQEKIRQKWQSLADPNAPLEVRRFQVLLAARLHARCQEPTVRKAMATLREAFPALTVQEVAKADPEVLALHITNLQYYNMKAKHLVQSSKEILERFHGIVPEDEQSLLQLTGIGRVFADLLSFVNTRAAHEKDIMVQKVNDDAVGATTGDATTIQETSALPEK